MLILLTLPFVGISGYSEYITVLANAGDFMGRWQNRDLGSTALVLGADDTIALLALLGGYAVAIGAVLLSLRRDREVGFMVTITASLLLSPLLWDHYFAILVLPAAFLADRVHPVFILLPLLAWLPVEFLPLVAIGATLIPFIVRDPEPEQHGDASKRPAGPHVAPT